jgi:hypothetical protein
MNITAEGYDMEIIREIEKNKQIRGDVAPKGEELRDTTANGRSENVKADSRITGKG